MSLCVGLSIESSFASARTHGRGRDSTEKESPNDVVCDARQWRQCGAFEAADRRLRENRRGNEWFPIDAVRWFQLVHIGIGERASIHPKHEIRGLKCDAVVTAATVRGLLIALIADDDARHVACARILTHRTVDHRSIRPADNSLNQNVERRASQAPNSHDGGERPEDRMRAQSIHALNVIRRLAQP